MRISPRFGNCRRAFNLMLLTAIHFFAIAGICATASDGSYVAAFRTSKHVTASKPEVFHGTVEEVVRYLESNKVDLVSDPLRPRIETQDAISIGSLVKIAKDAGASYLLYIVVDRPLTQWLKVTVQCYDLDQKMLWQATAGYSGSFDINSKNALPEIMKKLGKELAPRFDHPGLMRKEASPLSLPSAERSSQS